MSAAPSSRALIAVKAIHSIIWAFFASCVVAIPWAAWSGRPALALMLAGLVFVEVLVLAFNKWSCPLTAVAARYTQDRVENFDIYLPRLLAKYNKQLFGTLYVAGTAYALVEWARHG